MPNQKAIDFFASLGGKRVAVCGVGTNNVPVILHLLSLGAIVSAHDRRTRDQLGEVADQLEAAGATLSLGESYLDDLDADLILRTPGMKPYLPQFETARAKGIPVTSEMELFFGLCPAPIYAVTGSDGKTTTTTIIAGLLAAAGKTVHLGGNVAYGHPMLPLALDLRPEDCAVVELSSFQLTNMTQSPDVAVVTNVAPNHLDWHTDMAEYIAAKKNLVSHQKPGDRAVLNLDNGITAGFAADCPGNISWFSRKEAVENGTYYQDGILYAAEDGRAIAILPASELKLPGDHIIEDFLAAIAAVWGVVPVKVIADFARSFGGVPHRCELVLEKDGVRWYNDTIATSPTRTMAGLCQFDRKVILIAGGYDKHIPYDPLGPVAAKTVKTALLMGATADAIEDALRPYGVPCGGVNGMEEAVSAARKLAGKGDIVFMSPASASFDLYKNFEERGEHFRKLVLENL